MKKIAWVLITILMILAAMALKPLAIGKEEKAISISGVISQVYEAGEKDVVFILDNSPKKYYINRGLENGLELDNLQKLINQEVTIKYPKYWTPLDWNNSIRHLSKLEQAEFVIYTEF